MPKRPIHSFQHFYLGIDPGKSGGFALLNRDSKILLLEKMPETEADIYGLFTTILLLCNRASTLGQCRIEAFIEQVRGYLGEGTEAPGNSMFNFGWNYGGVRMAMIGNGVAINEVPPQVWQKALKIPSRKKEGRRFKETKSVFKNRLKARAQQLFPRVYITLATCDALLIAEYCRRKFLGIL